MTAVITLVVDDETAAGFKSAIGNAEKLEDQTEKIMGLSREQLAIQKRINSERTKGAQQADASAGASIGQIAKMGLAFLSVEKGIQLAKNVVAGVTAGITKAADEAERLGDSGGEIRVLAQQFKAAELITAEMARNLGKSNDAMSQSATIVARAVAGYKEFKSEILTGKNLTQLDSEQRLRLQKILVREQALADQGRNNALNLQKSTEKELEFIKQRSLRVLGKLALGDQQRAGFLKDLQDVSNERNRRELAAIEKRREGFQKILDLRKAILEQTGDTRGVQPAEQAGGRIQAEAERRKQLDASERERRASALTIQERAAATQLDQDKAQIAAATRLRGVQEDQLDVVNRSLNSDKIRVQFMRQNLRGQGDQEKALKDILAVEKRITKQTEERNKIQDKLRDTENKIEEARKTAAANRIKETREKAKLDKQADVERLKAIAEEEAADRKAFFEKRQRQDEAVAGQLGQRGVVQQAAQRLDPRQVMRQIARDRAAQTGSTVSAQLGGVRRDLAAGRISQAEVAKAQANLLHEAVQSAVGQGKLNANQAAGFQKAVIALQQQSQDVEALDTTVKGLIQAVDALTNNRRARRQQAGGRP